MRQKLLFLLISALIHVAYVYSGPVIPRDSLIVRLNESQTLEDSALCLSRIMFATQGKQIEELKLYSHKLESIAEKLEDTNLKADVYDAIAKYYRMSGNRESAKQLYHKSIKISQKNNYLFRVASSSFKLAELMRNSGENNGVEYYARTAFVNFIRIGYIENAARAFQILEQLNHEEYADNNIDGLIEMAIDNRTEEQLMFLYLYVSNYYQMLGNGRSAMAYVQLAIELADKNQNVKGVLKAYSSIATYFDKVQNNYAMALKYYEKLEEQFQQNNNMQSSSLLLSIGEMNWRLGNDSLALKSFNQALQISEEGNKKHDKADAYRSLGDLYYQKQEYNDALYYYSKCYTTGCDVCPKIRFHNALLNIGNTYLFSGDIQSALSYYHKSLALADSSADARASAKSYLALGALYRQTNNANRAAYNFEKAYAKAVEIDFLNGQQEAAQKLSEVFGLLHEYKKAYSYSNISKTLSDSLAKINQADNLAQLETYFDFKNLKVENELEKAKSEEEIRKQKNIRNYYLFGLLISSIIGVIVFLSYRSKRKDNRLLQQQKEEIRNMAEIVHKADQSKLQFYTNISHELKTPLTVIIGAADKVKNAINGKGNAEIIRRNSLKLLNLINHLLDLRKIDTSDMKLAVMHGNISEFVKGISSYFSDYAKQNNIELTYIKENKPIIGYFDSDKLEKILANLISNAIKYNVPNGWVKINCETEGVDFININIRDSGIGISETDQKNVFNRFYRASNSNVKGSGIGLSLVKELVDLHKGEITVISNINEGSSFNVRLPISKKFYSERQIVINKAEDNTWNYIELLESDATVYDDRDTEEINMDSDTLLIVEDNLDLRKYIAGIFKDKYKVIEAENGEEGYHEALRIIPDAIISDIMMPKLNGFQLLEKIKDDAVTSHIPVVLLTAKDDINSRISGFEKGADEYISKPFDASLLMSRVENLLRLRKQLVEKFSQEFQLEPRQIQIENAEQKFLQDAIAIIEKHISNPNLNIELLAMELNVSRTQLYRKLKALTNYSANQFIRIIRLKRAAQILKQGQNNLAEVMDATGFSNYSYFNNCFKEYFGEYPKKYALLSIEGTLN